MEINKSTLLHLLKNLSELKIHGKDTRDETCRFVYLHFRILTSYKTGFLTVRFTRAVSIEQGFGTLSIVIVPISK